MKEHYVREFTEAVNGRIRFCVEESTHSEDEVGHRGAYLRTVPGPGGLAMAGFLSHEDAPEYALAVLEAAKHHTGYSSDPVTRAMDDLRQYVEDRKAAAEKAADLAKLDEEAEALYKASWSADPWRVTQWKYVDSTVKSNWHTVALKARELHKTTD